MLRKLDLTYFYSLMTAESQGVVMLAGIRLLFITGMSYVLQMFILSESLGFITVLHPCLGTDDLVQWISRAEFTSTVHEPLT